MRILTTCASRNRTDLLGVELSPSSDDDEIISEIGDYIYGVLQKEWLDSPHEDVGEKREKMIEQHSDNYRARVKLDIRYRERRMLFKLVIDRLPKNALSPFGQKTLDFAKEIERYLFDAVCCIIYKNSASLSSCVFQWNETMLDASHDVFEQKEIRVYDNGKWDTAADAIMSKLLAEDSSAGGLLRKSDQRMRGELQEVECAAGKDSDDALRTLA